MKYYKQNKIKFYFYIKLIYFIHGKLKINVLFKISKFILLLKFKKAGI
jgi:hypothetical protein